MSLSVGYLSMEADNLSDTSSTSFPLARHPTIRQTISHRATVFLDFLLNSETVKESILTLRMPSNEASTQIELNVDDVYRVVQYLDVVRNTNCALMVPASLLNSINGAKPAYDELTLVDGPPTNEEATNNNARKSRFRWLNAVCLIVMLALLIAIVAAVIIIRLGDGTGKGTSKGTTTSSGSSTTTMTTTPVRQVTTTFTLSDTTTSDGAQNTATLILLLSGSHCMQQYDGSSPKSKIIEKADNRTQFAGSAGLVATNGTVQQLGGYRYDVRRATKQTIVYYRFGKEMMGIDDLYKSGPDLPFAMYGMAASALPDSIIMCGGIINGTPSEKCFQQFDGHERWAEIESYPEKLAFATMVQLLGRIYIFGGATTISQEKELIELTISAKVYSINMTDVTEPWLAHKSVPLALAHYGATQFYSELDDVQAIVCGGRSETAINQQCFVYDAVTDSWTTTAPLRCSMGDDILISNFVGPIWCIHNGLSYVELYYGDTQGWRKSSTPSMTPTHANAVVVRS